MAELIKETKCVRNVIILGKEKKQLFFISSHYVSDYNVCNLEDDRTSCLKCNSDYYRVLLSAAPSECKCNYGRYDDGVNEFCKKCHYSWFKLIYIYLSIYISVPLQSMIAVIQKKMLMDVFFVIILK